MDGTSASDKDYGTVTLGPSHPGNVTFANGINVSYGILTLGSSNGGSYTLNGNSLITNDSALIAPGGRYQADPFIVNGTLGVSNSATEDWLSAFASPSLAPCSVAQRGTYSMRAVARELIVGM